jgi:hypothetical protein
MQSYTQPDTQSVSSAAVQRKVSGHKRTREKEPDREKLHKFGNRTVRVKSAAPPPEYPGDKSETGCITTEHYIDDAKPWAGRFDVRNCLLAKQPIAVDHDTSSVPRGEMEAMKEGANKLPIYLINAHSAIDLNVTLVPPKGLPPFKIGKGGNIAKALEEGYTIERAERASHDPPDFFIAPEKAFIIVGSPAGTSALCGGWDDTIKSFCANLDVRGSGSGLVDEDEDCPKNVDKLRNDLLSTAFREVFTRKGEHERTIFTPPGSVALNKTFQFWDDPPLSRELWGIYSISALAEAGKLVPRQFETRIPRDNRTSKNSVGLRSLMRNKILESVPAEKKAGSFISMKDIVETLGPGIYLDLSCSTFNIYVNALDTWSMINPEAPMNSPEELDARSLVSSLMDALNNMTDQENHSWNNIVASGNARPDEALDASFRSKKGRQSYIDFNQIYPEDFKKHPLMPDVEQDKSLKGVMWADDTKVANVLPRLTGVGGRKRSTKRRHRRGAGKDTRKSVRRGSRALAAAKKLFFPDDKKAADRLRRSTRRRSRSASAA